MLYAVRPDYGYFALSPRGRITVDEKGSTMFAAEAGGTRRYLIADDKQRSRIIEAVAGLISEPPQRCK
jgi:hypothetical protein